MNKEASSIVVKSLEKKDIFLLTKVHFLAFPKSVLTILGERAVNSYYEWQFISNRHRFFYPLGAFDKNELVGFCLSGVFKGAMSHFLSRNKFLLARALLLKPHLLFREEFRRKAFVAVRILTKRKKSNGFHEKSVEKPDEKKFGILSIAVSPKAQGFGIGKQLLDEAERFAREKNFNLMNLTVDKNNNQAIRFYEKNGWEKTLVDGEWSGAMGKRLK